MNAIAAVNLPPYMQTHSGRMFGLVDCVPNEVHWPDVAWHLAHVNRFGGAAGGYTVAQHCWFVASVLPPRWHLYGLLHDAEEFATGDIIRPMQLALAWYGVNPIHIKRLKDEIRRAIYLAAGLKWPVPEEIEHAVKRADIRALWTEKRDLLVKMDTPNWAHGVKRLPPFDKKIAPWSPDFAYRAFLSDLEFAGIYKPTSIESE